MPQSSSSSVDIVSACGVLFTLMPTERRTAIYGMTRHTRHSIGQYLSNTVCVGAVSHLYYTYPMHNRHCILYLWVVYKKSVYFSILYQCRMVHHLCWQFWELSFTKTKTSLPTFPIVSSSLVVCVRSIVPTSTEHSGRGVSWFWF